MVRQYCREYDPCDAVADACHGFWTVDGHRSEATCLGMNLAPVLDINSNPETQSLAFALLEKRLLVGQLGAWFIRGQQEVGVASVAKHFPGLEILNLTHTSQCRRFRLMRRGFRN